MRTNPPCVRRDWEKLPDGKILSHEPHPLIGRGRVGGEPLANAIGDVKTQG